MIRLLDISRELSQCKDIKFYDICTIYQPTLDIIVNSDTFTYNDYRLYLLPYIMNNVYCKRLDLSNFDLLFEPIDIQEDDKDNPQEIILSPIFYKSLLFFIKEKFNYDENLHCVYFNDDKTKKIDKYNFDEFANVILQMCNEVRLQRPNYEKNEKENERKFLKKLDKFRKDNIKRHKQDISIYDVYLTVQYVKNYTDEEMNNLTMWKLMFLYKTIQNEEAWRNTFNIALAGGSVDDDKTDKRHWLEKIKAND